MLTMPIPKTENPHYGFYGTIRHARLPVKLVWSLAFWHLHRKTALPPGAILIFLDSRWGRHFADRVVEKLCRETGRYDGRRELGALDRAVREVVRTLFHKRSGGLNRQEFTATILTWYGETLIADNKPKEEEEES